jgi:hypothetical protein
VLACCQTQHRTQQQLPILQLMAQSSVLKPSQSTTLLLLLLAQQQRTSHITTTAITIITTGAWHRLLAARLPMAGR